MSRESSWSYAVNECIFFDRFAPIHFTHVWTTHSNARDSNYRDNTKCIILIGWDYWCQKRATSVFLADSEWIFCCKYFKTTVSYFSPKTFRCSLRIYRAHKYRRVDEEVSTGRYCFISFIIPLYCIFHFISYFYSLSPKIRIKNVSLVVIFFDCCSVCLLCTDWTLCVELLDKNELRNEQTSI